MADIWLPLEIPALSKLRQSGQMVQVDAEIHDWMRPSAQFVIDLSEGTYRTSPAQYVHALSNPSPRHVRGIYRSRIYNQLIYGSHHFNAFIGQDNTIQFQGIGDAKYRLQYHVEHQRLPPELKVPMIKAAESQYYVNYNKIESRGISEIDGPVFFGSPIEPTNWGMWLLQGLQSASAFVRSGQDGRLLCFSSVPFQRMLLNVIGVNEAKIMNYDQWRTYFCKEVNLLQYSRDVSFAVRPSDQALFDDIIERSKKSVSTRFPDKIFVSRRSITSRKQGTYRALLNEEKLCEAMENLGFVVVEPEKLSFKEQVVMFNSARVIVGLGGAGMFNTVFCRPGTSVITIESSTAFVDNHATLFASLALRYGVIFGAKDSSDDSGLHARWNIDIAKVTQAIIRFGE